MCGFAHSVWLDEAGAKVVSVTPVTRFALPYLEDVSERVAADVREGIQAANSGCRRAAAVMLRRAIERACDEAGAASGTLKRKIDVLNERGAISEVTAMTAHAIRAFGNYGAHPNDDLLDDVSEEELEAAVKFTAALVEGMAKLT